MAHSPFVVNNPNGKIANLEPPKEVSDVRMARRVEMLGLTEMELPPLRSAVRAPSITRPSTPRPSG